MYDATALRELVRTILCTIGLWSEDAENLLLGTAAKETHLGKLGRVQIGGGPAKSIYQVEPKTAQYLWERTQKEKPELFEKIVGVVGSRQLDLKQLEYDIVLSTVLARLKYYYVPHPIPSTLEGWAEYWKKHYNTYMGKGHPSEFISCFKLYVEA